MTGTLKNALVAGMLTAATALACAAGAREAAQTKPLLRAGDRMVSLGDSITEQRIYTRYVMNYFTLRYPGAHVSFRNAGWGGDTAPGGLARLERDVLSLKPTVVSICFGMNDGRYTAFDQANYDQYMAGMHGLVSELKKARVKVVLLTVGCVDPDRNAGLQGYNDTLAALAKGVKELAVSEKLPVFDLHSLMLDVQTRAKKDDPGFTMIPDGVHPSQPGQAVMAYALLKALGCSRQPSALWIRADKARAVPYGCKVRNLKVTKDLLSFTRTDSGLPTYFDPEADAVKKYLPLMRDFNQYRLRVTGLRAGTWKLVVEGIEVGAFTADELATGVDLGERAGPWRKLGQEVNALSSEQENLYFHRWREVSLGPAPAGGQSELDAMLGVLDKALSDKEAERIRKAAENHVWKWTFTREVSQ